MVTDQGNFVRVYRAANSPEAYLIKGMLEQHGVSVRLFGDGLSSGVGELPADVIQVEIQVSERDRRLAQELIGDYESRAVEVGKQSGHWVCRNCREENPVAFDICWQCQQPANV